MKKKVKKKTKNKVKKRATKINYPLVEKIEPIRVLKEIKPRPTLLKTEKEVLRGRNIPEIGRELDKIVAREVLGWTTYTPSVPPSGISILTPTPPEMIFYKEGHETSERMLPLFSTSVPAAMELFQKIRDQGHYCCLKINSDYYYCYDVVLILSEMSWVGFKNGVHGPDVCVTSEQLPMAICLALLEGARLMKRMIEKNDELRTRLKNRGAK